MRHPLLLGHRGLRLPGEPPENTMAAFERALELGCDGFEFDVRQTADGYAVICHDAQYSSQEIASASYAQIRQLALLDDVLARFAGRVFLDIELKVPGLEEALLADLERYDLGSGFVISSFFPRILQQLHSLNARVPLGFLCNRESALAHWRELKTEYVIPHFSLLTPDLISEFHRAGRKALSWTVNTTEDMSRLKDWGVDGIISDDPALLVRTLAG
jgi:glycerophosphoryl diester phosphodiesterase